MVRAAPAALATEPEFACVGWARPGEEPRATAFLPAPPTPLTQSTAAEVRSPMLPKRRRARVGTPGPDSSAARFPGVAIYLAEPHMGRSRRAFLTRLALSKGFRVLDAYRCAGWEQLPEGGDTYLG